MSKYSASPLCDICQKFEDTGICHLCKADNETRTGELSP